MRGHIEFSPSEISRVIPVLFPHLKKSGAELRGVCKLHGGKNDSFTLNPNAGLWDCKSKCGHGGDLISYQMELTGQDFRAAKAAVYGIIGRDMEAMAPNPVGEFIVRNGNRLPIEAAYSYQDSTGKVSYRVVRLAVQADGKKDFSQQRTNGKGGWICGLAGTEPLPYRLPQLAKAERVFVVEGEKDADSLSRLGLVATCNNGGAGNFKRALVPHFAGKHVIIIPDNDEPGRKHAEAVAGLLESVAASVCVVHLPGLAEKGDVSDWIEAGGTEAELRGLVRNTPLWEPRATVETEAPATAAERQGIRCIADIRPLSAYAGQQIDWIVPGVLATGTITLLSGDSGSGKTTFTDAIIDRVGYGEPFAGLHTQKRPALIMDRENPATVAVERRARIGITTDNPNVRTWGGWCEDEPCDPGSPIITGWVASCDPKPVIVIDSFVAFAQCDENSASEVRAFMQPLRRLADMGATVILLHHSGKGETSKDFRGSSDIKAAVDVAYHLSNMGDPSRLSTLKLRAFKSRFSVLPEILLHYHEGQGFRMDERPAYIASGEVLRCVLTENPGVSQRTFKTLAASKGISERVAREFLKGNIDARKIRIERGPRNSDCLYWAESEGPASQASWGPN